MFNLKSIPGHRVWAIISLLCSILTVAESWFILNGRSEFWQDDANRQAHKLAEINITMSLGFTSGLFFSVLSLGLQRSKFGFLCLLVNATPFLLSAIAALIA